MKVEVPYVTAEDLKRYRGLTSKDNQSLAAGDDDRLRGFTLRASRMWNAVTKRVFYPRRETRYYDYPRDIRRLKLDDDLLEIISFTTQNGNETVTTDQYFLKCGQVYGQTPYDRVEMKSDSTRPHLLFSGTVQQSQAITGYWGYHESWADAWLLSGDTVQSNPLSLSDMTLTVNDVDGTDIYGETNRFKVQQLIRIESEYLFIIAKNVNTNVLTVIRGVNGTTAAAHVQGTAIYIYYPMPDIVQAMIQLSAWLYSQKDNNSAVVDQPMVMPNGMVILPKGIPKEVKEAAGRYVRHSRGIS